MIEQSIERLAFLLATIPNLLNEISDEEFSFKPSLQKWSKKEILGHLIDSATNNHHRFVRAQFENNPTITYNQDEWCKHGFYQQMAAHQVIAFWTAYNLQLLELFKQMPLAGLTKVANDLTLDFLMADYVSHLEYHLKQIVAY